MGANLSGESWIRNSVNAAVIHGFCLRKQRDGLVSAVFNSTASTSFTAFYKISFTKNFFSYPSTLVNSTRDRTRLGSGIFTSLHHPGALNVHLHEPHFRLLVGPLKGLKA